VFGLFGCLLLWLFCWIERDGPLRDSEAHSNKTCGFTSGTSNTSLTRNARGTMNDDPWDARSVAYHEAGHAVVAWLNHLQIDQVTVDSEGASAGHMVHEIMYYPQSG
jgi:hypothetical protein